MTETEQSIRESLLNTLAFLASESQQSDFAAKVDYKVYQDEFACWWFDTFYPDDPGAKAMFSESELEALRFFSNIFDKATRALQNRPLSIQDLQSTDEWRQVVVSAKHAKTEVQGAA
jgi:hypothetical protein